MAPFTPLEIFLLLISVSSRVDPRATGMEPATFLLVAQCLNQLHHRAEVTGIVELHLHSSCDLHGLSKVKFIVLCFIHVRAAFSSDGTCILNHPLFGFLTDDVPERTQICRR